MLCEGNCSGLWQGYLTLTEDDKRVTYPSSHHSAQGRPSDFAKPSHTHIWMDFQSPKVSSAAGFTQHRASRESLFSPCRQQTAGHRNKQSTPALPIPCCHLGSHRPLQSHSSTLLGDHATVWLLMTGDRQDTRAKRQPTGSRPPSSPLINHVLSYTNLYYVNLYRLNIHPHKVLLCYPSEKYSKWEIRNSLFNNWEAVTATLTSNPYRSSKYHLIHISLTWKAG